MEIEKMEDIPYDDLVLINDFDTTDKIFDLYSTGSTCHELATVVCALEAFKNASNSQYFEYCCK